MIACRYVPAAALTRSPLAREQRDHHVARDAHRASATSAGRPRAPRRGCRWCAGSRSRSRRARARRRPRARPRSAPRAGSCPASGLRWGSACQSSSRIPSPWFSMWNRRPGGITAVVYAAWTIAGPADAVAGLERLELVHRRVDPAVEVRLARARRASPRSLASSSSGSSSCWPGHRDPQHERVDVDAARHVDRERAERLAELLLEALVDRAHVVLGLHEQQRRRRPLGVDLAAVEACRARADTSRRPSSGPRPRARAAPRPSARAPCALNASRSTAGGPVSGASSIIRCERS